MDFLSRDPMPVADHFMAHRFRARPTVPSEGVFADAVAVGAAVPVTRSSHGPVGTKTGIEVCEQCFECSPGREELWKHVRDAHGDDARLQCAAAGCGRRFSSLAASAGHRSHHAACGDGQAPYTCELCGRLSANHTAFDKHVAKEHPTARAALCGVCGRYAGDVQSLMRHVDAAHGAHIWSEVVACKTPSGDGVGPVRTRRTIRCDVCGKRYGNNHLMRSHRQVHGSIKSPRGDVADQESTAHSCATATLQ
ncbi:zinc finger protein 771-like [Sipha flava]|uniref:Zinc finger protein n=1 Tax=Sipha flava TaxID=143950 RepID=A0A2S2Q185_9HEMI|nr:zinc finger protein 771-like [Sipha flava]